VFDLLKKNFIVVSLYVDDKKNLPPMEQFTYITKDGTEKFIRTIGDKWSTFETENFSNNSQPWYAIIDNNERVLTKPVGYTDSETEYLDWLQCGWDTFNKNK
jgi:thiol:disulfide interchange protein DsbD